LQELLELRRRAHKERMKFQSMRVRLNANIELQNKCDLFLRRIKAITKA